jgi:ribulose-5-phosphate 4-epimerase/fuculose-1-phosphate aldolase
MATVAARKEQRYTAKQARVELAAAHRLAVMDGLRRDGAAQHFTLVDPEDANRMIVTNMRMAWSQMSASNLETLPAVIGSEEEVTDPALWVPYRIHRPIHDARPDALCVMHLHPTYTTVLSMIDTPLITMASQGALLFHDKVAYTEEYDGAVAGSGLDSGRLFAKVLGADNMVVVCKNHGSISVGRTVAHAYSNLIALEEAAKLQILALSTGRPLQLISKEAMAPWFQYAGNVTQIGAGVWDYRQSNFDAMMRVLDKTQPDYRD